jgi:hypothetical protein
MQHNTCYHEEQGGGHSWYNGLVVPDSWHNSVDTVHMYFGRNLKVSFLLVLLQIRFYYVPYQCLIHHWIMFVFHGEKKLFRLSEFVF